MFDSDPLAALALLVLASVAIAFLYYSRQQALFGLRPNSVAHLMANITFGVSLGHVAIYMVIPAILRPITGWADDLELGIDRSEVVFVYLIETTSFAVWAAGFVLVWRRRWFGLAEQEQRGQQQSGHGEMMDTEARLFLGMVLGLSVWRTIDMWAFGGSLQTVSLDESDFQARWGWLVGPLADKGGAVVGLFVLALGRAKVGTVLWILAAVAVAIYAATFGTTGVRGAAVWPLMWWILLVALRRGRRAWFRSALPAVALLVPLVVFNEYFKDALQQRSAAGPSLDLGGKLASLKGEEAKSSSVLDSSATRLGCASRFSVGFVRMWDSGRGAYWHPIVNTLYAPLPRRFFPDKPAPTSLTGDQFTMGMYLCVTEFTAFQNYSMTEFLTGAHAYWEFGWVGVVGISLVGGMLLALIASLLCRMGLAGPGMIFFFFKPWGYNNPKLWFSDLMLEIVQIAPITFVLWRLSTFLTKRLSANAPVSATSDVGHRSGAVDASTEKPV